MSRYWFALVVFAAWLAGCQPSPAPIVVAPPPASEPTAAPTPAPIRVYVSGAVVNPNKVYVLPPRSIGEDAVRAAGGPSSEADLDRVNLAQELRDQEHFHVPRKNETPTTFAVAEGVLSAAASARLNINTATAQELDQLPKIGPATAQLIIEYRARNGPFKQAQEIMNVKGIGEATFDQIKDMITVGD